MTKSSTIVLFLGVMDDPQSETRVENTRKLSLFGGCPI